jgi:hypothetical protein
VLEEDFVGIHQCAEDSRAGAEPAEDGSLAQAGPLGQAVHGHLVDPVLRDHLPGHRKQVLAVAGRVRALATRLTEGQQRRVHAPNLPPDHKRGEVRDT